jgi:hypothetical protein
VLQNEWQPNILDRLYQIMFKIIILSQIGADRYQKHIFKILLLSPPWSVVPWDVCEEPNEKSQKVYRPTAIPNNQNN